MGNEEFTGEHHSQDDSLDHGKRTETTLEVEADNSDITGSVNSDEATRSGMGKPKDPSTFQGSWVYPAAMSFCTSPCADSFYKWQLYPERGLHIYLQRENQSYKQFL